MVKGWTSSTTYTLMDALATYVKLGVQTFLITSITKDGTLSGPDLDTIKEVCKGSGAEVIAAGGIGSLNNLVGLKRIGATAAVVGKALYEEIHVKEALEKIRRLKDPLAKK
jgi:phosphoribosylformimino-5-aminoimidazole carboxamide ribotide isomerase